MLCLFYRFVIYSSFPCFYESKLDMQNNCRYKRGTWLIKCICVYFLEKKFCSLILGKARKYGTWINLNLRGWEAYKLSSLEKSWLIWFCKASNDDHSRQIKCQRMCIGRVILSSNEVLVSITDWYRQDCCMAMSTQNNIIYYNGCLRLRQQHKRPLSQLYLCKTIH